MTHERVSSSSEIFPYSVGLLGRNIVEDTVTDIDGRVKLTFVTWKPVYELTGVVLKTTEDETDSVAEK